jgi:VWFA-related protein
LRKFVGLSFALLFVVGLAAFSAAAQDAAAPTSTQENLPSKPQPAAKPNPFAPPNSYEYPHPAPFTPPKHLFEADSIPIATRLEPFRPSREESAGNSVAPQAQNEIRSYANEVLAPVTVIDAKNHLVLDLQQKDFHIFDNGAEQKIVHWDMGGDPLAVALVVETSSHVQALAPVIHGMGNIFTETVMAANGEAAVISFDSTVDVRQPFTADHDAVAAAIEALRFPAPEMRLHDAMAAAVELLTAQPPNFRRVMLVVGESQDQGSDAKLRLVLRDAQLANITIYGVGLSSALPDLRSHAGWALTPEDTPPPPQPLRPSLAPVGVAEHAAQQPYWDYMTPAIWLATQGLHKIKDRQIEIAVASTGGVHYHAFRDRTIREALDRIGDELHSQYILGYAPTAQPAPGYHEITVTVARPNTTVRTRPGYFLAASESSAARAQAAPD